MRERTLTLDELAAAAGALSLSTLQEAQPVAEVAGAARFDPGAARVCEVREAIREVVAARVAAGVAGA